MSKVTIINIIMTVINMREGHVCVCPVEILKTTLLMSRKHFTSSNL